MLKRAGAAGVTELSVCGTSPDDWIYCIDAQKKFQGLENFPVVYSSIGIHPWFLKGRNGAPSRPNDAGFQRLEKLLRDNPMLSVGETGLDFSDPFGSRTEQEVCFAAHLDLARELNRPVTVHCVQAWGRMVEMVKKHPAPKILLHAYSGSVELIPELMKLNCWFSFGLAVMNPKSKKARAAVVAVPADRLLIETDSTGDPGKLIQVARATGELRGVSVDEISELTFRNAQQLFS